MPRAQDHPGGPFQPPRAFPAGPWCHPVLPPSASNTRQAAQGAGDGIALCKEGSYEIGMGERGPRVPLSGGSPSLAVPQNLPWPSLDPVRPHPLGGLPASWDTTCQADGQTEIACPTQGPQWLRNSRTPRTLPAPLHEDPRENKGTPPKVGRRDGPAQPLPHIS